MAKPLCLVTGACGFMGTHMVEVLLEAGYPVRATDLPQAYERDDPARGRFPSVLKARGVEFVPADLRDKDSLERAVAGVGYVFHLGAVFSYSAPWSLLEAVNVGGTRNLCELLRHESGFRKIVFWGAGGIYDIFKTPGPIDEQAPRKPANDYLRSKLLAEEFLADFCGRHEMAYSIVRGTTVYGPRGVYGGGQMIMAAAKPPVVAVPSNWTFRLPFVHAVDVCRAGLHVAERPACDGEDYIVNDDSTLSFLEFMAFVADLTGHLFLRLPPVPPDLVRRVLVPVAGAVQAVSKRLGVQSPIERDTVAYLGLDLVYSNAKLKATGFAFRYPDARVGIAETVAWYQRNGWL